jgi:2-oxoacid:acceptor oxidoreductase gamma subunit (pyruvate/2-ketoisovalerate family)
MIEIRFHGRGGQGAVTSAELLALAAINEGKYAQAFPSFGPERRGAPVQVFSRVDDKPIRLRSQIYEPDVVLVLDPSLVNIMDVTVGLKEGGAVVVNTTNSLDELSTKLAIRKGKIGVVDGTSIARKYLGRPITNTTMLGALIRATGVVNIEHMHEPLHHRFGPIAAKNEEAMRAAYRELILKEIES